MRKDAHLLGTRCVPVLLVLTGWGCAAATRPHEPHPGWAKGVGSAPPSLQASGWEHWEQGFEAAYRVLLENLHLPHASHRTRHAHAAPAVHGVHLWDTAFMSQVWRTWDFAVARDVLQAPFAHAANGRLPHFCHWFLKNDLTQPPLMAWAVWESFRRSQDTAAVASVYPQLQAYNAWLYAHRRLPSGLFSWSSPLESGMDNSPRFDAARGTGKTRATRSLAAVDLSSYMVLQNAVLSQMARTLGRDAEARLYAARADDARALVNDLLWDEAAGFYFDHDEGAGEKVRIRTAASLVTLFAGVPDPGRAERLVAQVMDPSAFNSLLPLPVVALDEPCRSKDMWRGPVWINVSYMIIRGLEEYGFAREAAWLAYHTVDGVFRTHAATGHLWEFYDHERYDVADLARKRGSIWKRLTLGAKPLPSYGWSALVNNLVTESLIGYDRAGILHRIAPRFPASAAGMQLTLILPREQLTVRLEVLPDGGGRGEVDLGTEVLPFDLAFGKPLQWFHTGGVPAGLQPRERAPTWPSW